MIYPLGFIDPVNYFINKGEIVEAFIGQELLAYSDSIKKESLYFWSRHARASQAEIDYLVQLKGTVIPIEVKAGYNKRIKSMHIFLDSHLHSPYGIRCWAGMYERDKKIHSYPLYAIIKPLIENNEHMREAIQNLISSRSA